MCKVIGSCMTKCRKWINIGEQSEHNQYSNVELYSVTPYVMYILILYIHIDRVNLSRP